MSHVMLRGKTANMSHVMLRGKTANMSHVMLRGKTANMPARHAAGHVLQASPPAETA